MKSSLSLVKIGPALVAAQKEMGNASKSAKNPFFKSKYADLNAIREAIIPALNAQDISVLQPIVHENEKSFVRTTLLHASGEYVYSETEIVCAKQNDPQAMGSAITYARRYDLQSLACGGAEDDDAESSYSRPVPEARTEVAKKKSTPLPSTDEF